MDWDAFQPSPTGWELNARGKLGPRVMNLGPTMDPRQLAESAVDLNLKLMRWRAAPALDTARLAATKCLLLGACARPCAVAQQGLPSSRTALQPPSVRLEGWLEHGLGTGGGTSLVASWRAASCTPKGRPGLGLETSKGRELRCIG